ncbi:17104_t:CDS:2, partial [Racocetra fulgida]
IEKNGVDAFLKSINELREANSKLEDETKNDESTKNDGSTNQEEDKPPKYPSFDLMMAMLFDKIQSEINNESPEEVGEELVRKLREHCNKLSKEQKEAKKELEKEEREAKKKITMDDLHTGINILNPDAKLKPLEGESFAAIKNYDDSYKFITDHPEVVEQDISDQILGEAFRAQLKGKDKYAKQYPQAREVFIKDVNETYDRIRERCKVMNAEKTQRPQKAQVEQIQIEVTDPNTSLN